MRTAERLPPVSSTVGTGDALDQLQQDHRRVETLFAQVSLTSGELQRSAIDLVLHELEQHARLEEELVYPAIAKALVGGDALVDRSEAEHEEMVVLIAALRRPRPGDAAELDDLRRLQLVVQAHVAVEEAEVFPAFRQRADSAQLEKLTGATAPARAAAPPPPERGPGLAAAVGEVVSDVLDTVRDAVSGSDEAPRAARKTGPRKKGTAKTAAKRTTNERGAR